MDGASGEGARTEATRLAARSISTSPGGRRPKLVDGLDWVPSSSANASYKMLKDGRSEIVRFYCSRRTKGEHARPQQKPYNVFAAERQEEVKAANPELNSYDVKKVLGQQWREMGAAAKRPYQEQSQHENRQLRQRMSAADHSSLPSASKTLVVYLRCSTLRSIRAKP